MQNNGAKYTYHILFIVFITATIVYVVYRPHFIKLVAPNYLPVTTGNTKVEVINFQNLINK